MVDVQAVCDMEFCDCSKKGSKLLYGVFMMLYFCKKGLATRSARQSQLKRRQVACALTRLHRLNRPLRELCD